MQPPFARLERTFDAAALERDLDAVLLRFPPLPQQSPAEVLRAQLGQTWIDDSEYAPLRTRWTALSLRAQGGDWRRTDPGVVGLHDFADTEVLEHAPAWERMLRELDLPLRAARLVTLCVGVRVPTHVDPGMDFAGGRLRLVVPLRTHANIEFTIDGVRLPHMRPGELWFTEVARPHSLSNPGPSDRHHLVIDTEIDERTLALFPSDERERRIANGFRHRREDRTQPLAPEEAVEFCGAFATASGAFGVPHAAHWNVDVADGGLRLCMDGEPRVALRHVGGGRFTAPGGDHDLAFEIDPVARTFTFVSGAERSTTTMLPSASSRA